MFSLKKYFRNLGIREVAALFFSMSLAVFMMYASLSWDKGSLLRGFLPDKRAVVCLVFTIPFVALVLRRIRARGVISSFERVALFIFLGMAIYLLSFGASHPWFFMFHWFSSDWVGDISGVEFLILCIAFCGPLMMFVRSGRIVQRVLALLFVFLQILSCRALVRATGFEAIYRDDHPSFMFRLHEFAQTYPAMTSLNPWWNAGVVNSVGASSGIGAIALPFFPVLHLFPVESCYTAIIGILFIVVVPLLSVFALRSVRASWETALSGGIIYLGVSRAFFVWMLHFGTVGSAFAMSFLPLFSLLAYRVCVMRRADIATLSGLGVSAFFLLQWPPCVFAILFTAAGWLLNIRRFRWKPHLKLLVAVVVVSLAMLPNIIAVVDNKELLSFVARDSAVDAVGISSMPCFGDLIKELLKTFSDRFPEIHPVVLFFGIVGVFFLPQRRLSLWLAPPIVLLFLLSCWGPLLAPRLQLERIALLGAVLAGVPAALFCGRILRDTGGWTAPVRVALIVLLLLGGVSVARLYRGGGYAPYSVIPPSLKSFVNLVNREVPPDGRLIFYGSTVHSFGGGHIACLPLMAEREMMACDYYAFPPGMVEYDYPPRQWRETADGVAKFMRLYGATHLATTRGDKAGIISKSNLFSEVDFREPGDIDFSSRVCNDRKLTEHMRLFALNGASAGRFYEGCGEVDADCGYIRVSLSPSLTNAVLRYAWSPLLSVDNGAELYPVEVASGVTFIGLRTRGVAPVTIAFRRGVQ